MNLAFTPQAWEDYMHWHRTDAKLVKRIHQLLQAILRTPFEGIGKPEPLRHHLAGYWSRRINEEHRLIYRVDGETITLIQLRYHYQR